MECAVRDFLRLGLHEVLLPFDGAAFGSSKTGYEPLGEKEAADDGGGLGGAVRSGLGV